MFTFFAMVAFWNMNCKLGLVCITEPYEDEIFEEMRTYLYLAYRCYNIVFMWSIFCRALLVLLAIFTCVAIIMPNLST